MNLTFDNIVEALGNRRPLAFSRFGDGEFRCIFGRRGHNCDGHQYFPALGQALRRILEARPGYEIGIQNFARKLYARHPRSAEFARLVAPFQQDADILHRANLHGRFPELFAALRKRSVAVIGPSHLAALDQFDFHHIVCPARDCWLACDDLLDRCGSCNAEVLIFCASMPAKVMIDRLWFPGIARTLVDFGSALDPHAGVRSRTYHAAIKIS